MRTHGTNRPSRRMRLAPPPSAPPVTAEAEPGRRSFFGRALGLVAGALLVGASTRRAEAGLEDLPFVGEIRLFAGSFAPAGWALCDGQLLPISQFETLFSLIGTTYGGDGQNTFALPDLRGSLAMHAGTGPGLTPRTVGEKAGEERVTLTTGAMPAHAHLAFADAGNGTSPAPDGLRPARNAAGGLPYGLGSNSQLAPEAIAPQGGSQPHDNMQPFLALNFCIALQGAYPQVQ
jgi:microcystin-dependent protein